MFTVLTNVITFITVSNIIMISSKNIWKNTKKLEVVIFFYWMRNVSSYMCNHYSSCVSIYFVYCSYTFPFTHVLCILGTKMGLNPSYQPRGNIIWCQKSSSPKLKQCYKCRNQHSLASARPEMYNC